MDPRAELSAFLKSRRARLRPADLGLPEFGGRRRVAGLRREEAAQLAGVSIAHYTRLEQGQGVSVSEEVLDAVARALRLDAHETAYLHRLARAGSAVTRREDVGEPVAHPTPRNGLRALMASFTTTPAILTGRHTDIVAWNHAAAAVFCDFAALAPLRRTISDVLFLEPEVRRLHGNGWEATAREHVAHLRVLAAQEPADRAAAAHVRRMCAKSPEFAVIWDSHPVARIGHRVYNLNHADAGQLELFGELVLLPGDPQYSGLDLFAPEPGSTTAAALAHLVTVSGRPASPGV